MPGSSIVGVGNLAACICFALGCQLCPTPRHTAAGMYVQLVLHDGHEIGVLVLAPVFLLLHSVDMRRAAARTVARTPCCCRTRGFSKI